MSNNQAVHSKEIWRLAWPQIVMMLCHFFIGLADVYVAGKLDTNVQAALGLISQVLFFFLILAMSLSNGTVSAISQSLGAGKKNRARNYTLLSLGLVFSAGLIIVLLALPAKGLLINILQTPQAVRPIASYFLVIYLSLLPIYYLFIVSNAIFRANKQVHIPMLSMGCTTLANFFGDFGLCFGLWGLPQMGFKGLAWATFLSVSTGCLVNLYILSRQNRLSLLEFPPLKWIKTALPYLWQVSWPAGLVQFLWHSAYMCLFALIASLPQGKVTALAAMAVGIRIESLLFLPAMAFNMTASILIGHHLGRQDFIGAKKTARRIWLMGTTLVSLVGLAVWLAAPILAGLLAPERAVQTEIINYLFFNILAIPFTATTLIFGGVFIGAGATKFNMLAIGGTSWLVRIPLAFLLGHLVFKQATGIWLSMLLSQLTQAILMSCLFISGKWRRFTMLSPKQPITHPGPFNIKQE